MVVTIRSKKKSGDISGLDIAINCLCTLNVDCDNHYLKLLGILHQNRCFDPVDQMGVDILAQ